MIKIIFLAHLFFYFLVSCHVRKETFPDWDQASYLGFIQKLGLVYTGFIDKINYISGDSAINCGFHETYVNSDISEAVDGYYCAKKAFKLNKPFKLGTLNLPIDSYWHEVFIKSDTDKFWHIIFDVMIDGTAPQLWIDCCENFKFNKSEKSLSGINCKRLDDYTW